MYLSIFTKALFIFFCFAISQMTFAQEPSSKQIIDWIVNLDESHANPANKISILHTEPMRLFSGEQAYVSSIEFKNSGRNFAYGYILTRPKLSKSKLLDFGGQMHDFSVYTVLYKGKTYDLAEFHSAGSGQGTSTSSATLVYFKDWQQYKITEVESFSSPGMDDLAGEYDCATGSDDKGVLNVLVESAYVLQTVVSGDGCASKADDYKISSKLIPILIE